MLRLSSSHRLGGDLDLQKFRLSAQHRPGRMESGEAGPVTLQLKQKTKHHAKTTERKANVPSDLLRDVLRYTKHLSISTHIRHLCYLCKGNNCGFGFLWFGISCIPEESQVNEISSLDFKFLGDFSSYTQALFERDVRDKFHGFAKVPSDL